MDPIAIRNGPGQRLQEHCSHPFAGDVAVTSLAKALAASCARGKVTLRKQQVLVGMNGDVHPAGDRDLAAAGLQTLTRQMYRAQGARAHRIHRDARPVEITEIRHPIRYRRGAATERVWLA